jgi:hypothetical protein
MRIYLDIDGTLVQKNGAPAPFLDEFIAFATKHHECYWLTTHCRDGDAKHALSYLRRLNVPEETLKFMKDIRPTVWDVLKTDAIDMKEPFLWLDDSPMVSELRALDIEGKRSSLRQISLKDNLYELKDVFAELRQS